MPKILFPENAWTLGALQGVNVVSNRIAPSKEIKVTVTNNTGVDKSGEVIIVYTHNYVFDLVNLVESTPRFFYGGALLPFQHQCDNIKDQVTLVKLQYPDESPISFLPGDSITLDVGTMLNTTPSSLGLIRTTTPHSFRAINNGDTSLVTVPLPSNSRNVQLFFYGDFRAVSETLRIAYAKTAKTSATVDLMPNREVALRGTTYPLPPEGNYIGVLESECRDYQSGVSLYMYDPDTFESVFSQNKQSNLAEYTTASASITTAGFKTESNVLGFCNSTSGGYYAPKLPLPTTDNISKLVFFPKLKGQLPETWSFNNAEEMYWLSPIIQLPHKGYLSSDWLETLGSGRVDIDGVDPQEYEIRYSDTAPDGDPLGTDLANTSGTAATAMPTLSYWAPGATWATASEWASAQKGHGAGPAKYYQVRVKFQQTSGGE